MPVYGCSSKTIAVIAGTVKLPFSTTVAPDNTSRPCVEAPMCSAKRAKSSFFSVSFCDITTITVLLASWRK